MSDFKESEHPRDADGKFTVKGKQSKRKALLNLLRKKRARTSSKVSGGISGALDSTSPEAEKTYNYRQSITEEKAKRNGKSRKHKS